MEFTLRIFVIALSIIVFISVIYMLVKRNINESNSILWLIIGFFTLLFGFFPDIVSGVSKLLGIDYPPALLFLISTVLLLLITFKSSMQLSKTDAKINEIAITLAIVKEENRRLEAKLEEISDVNAASGEENDN